LNLTIALEPGHRSGCWFVLVCFCSAKAPVHVILSLSRWILA
jgi:hypothetical protein